MKDKEINWTHEERVNNKANYYKEVVTEIKEC